MLSSGRVVLILLLCFSCVLSNNNKQRKNKHIIALLGYLHGYKIGYDYATKLSPAVPIVILPIVNQHQSVSILKNIYGKYQENGVKEPIKLPVKLTSSEWADINDIYNDVESVPNKSIKRDVSKPDKTVSKEKEGYTTPKWHLTFSKPVNVSTTTNKKEQNGTVSKEKEGYTAPKTHLTFSKPVNVSTTTNKKEQNGSHPYTTKNMSVDKNATVVINGTDTNYTIYNTTEHSVPGFYPNAQYENQLVNTLTLTKSPDEILTTENNRLDELRNNSNSMSNTTKKYDNNVYQHIATTESSGPYTAALYNNNKINGISLTTNIYVKDAQLPPQPDNNWHKFSPNSPTVDSGQFKPLAGLYYDGFLNRPIKKQQFIPKYWYNYYF